MPPNSQDEAYALRLQIESSMHELLDNGFTVADVEDFVLGVVEAMREEDEDGG